MCSAFGVDDFAGYEWGYRAVGDGAYALSVAVPVAFNITILDISALSLPQLTNLDVAMRTVAKNGEVSDLYNVIYNFAGWEMPVDNVPTLNTANSGQAIPLKWRITDVNGSPVTNLANVVVTAVSLPCAVGTTPDQLEEYAPGASGLLNQGNGNYQFNWKTPKTYAQSCKTMKLDLAEGPGMERTALFQFTK